MKIKDRLSINFTLISNGMLLIVLCSVYFIFMKFLEADFYTRLKDRTMVTAELYLEADEISRDALDKVRNRYLEKLSDEVIRIYDKNNKASFIGDNSRYWTEQTINKVRKEGKIRFKDGDHQVVGIYYKDNQGDFVILASAADLSSANRLSKLFKIMAATFVVFSILLLLSGRWVAQKILQPLQLLMEEVQKVGSGNLEFRVKQTDNKDEINELARSFNQLIEELEQAFILQKTFVANASHELRTPVTSVIMSAELALSKERDPEHYKKTLISVLEDSTKINHIITGLLTLAKADLELSSAQLAPLNLLETLYDLQAEWAKKDLHVALNTVSNATDIQVLANPILLQIAFNNIIANGFKFSENQTVTCNIACIKNEMSVRITDKGVGIAAEDLEHIFNPFYSKSERIGQTGDGMGLYMASKIIHLFKGKIKIGPATGSGSTFTVVLPKALIPF